MQCDSGLGSRVEILDGGGSGDGRALVSYEICEKY